MTYTFIQHKTVLSLWYIIHYYSFTRYIEKFGKEFFAFGGDILDQGPNTFKFTIDMGVESTEEEEKQFREDAFNFYLYDSLDEITVKHLVDLI